MARETVAAGVPRLVLVSGIGADANSGSPYICARGRGELMVQQTFPGATIVRPGAMFGPGDALFGTLAELARLLPVLPLIGSGSTRLQPVFVEDVAEAVARILTDRGMHRTRLGDVLHEHVKDRPRRRMFLASVSFLLTFAGLRLLTWSIHNNIGLVHHARGELEPAVASMERAVALEEIIGHPDLEDDRRVLDALRAQASQEADRLEPEQ